MSTTRFNKMYGTALTVLLLGSVAVPASAQNTSQTPEPVIWTGAKNVTVSGSTITEACNGCGDAGAVSQQTLASGDGYFDFTVGTKDIFGVGIGGGPPSTSIDSIEYALRFNGNGSAEVRENGRYITDTRYKEGDRFRIAVEGGAVNYYLYGGSENNWVPIHSNKMPASLQYPIKIEAVLLGPKTSITQAVAKSLGRSQVSAITGPANSSPAANITWTNVSNATANGSTLVSTTDNQNSGAQSAETLTGDGWVEFTAVETDKMRAVGLDHENSSNTLQDIDYGIVLREAAKPGATPVAEVWEKGAYVSDIPYNAGDRFRIAIEGGKVKYYKYVNGQLQEIPGRNSSVAAFPVHLDAALYGAQSSIADVTGTRQN
jgi:hypothetical protein